MPSGVFGNAIGVDLSYLMFPVIGFIALRTVKKLVMVVLPRLGGKLLASLLGGASIAVLVYSLMSWLSREQNVDPQISIVLDSVTGYLMLMIAGITVGMLSSILDEEEEGRIAVPATGAAGKLLTGFAFNGIFNTLGEYWDVFPMIGTAILAGFIASSVASMAVYGEKARNRYVSEVGKMISQSGVGLFFVGAFIYSYMAFIRPAISDSFNYTALVEWGIVCIGAFLLYRRIRISVQSVTFPEAFIVVRKHSQLIEEIADRKIEELGEIQERFIEKGQRTGLLVALIYMLVENRWERERITVLLAPLINYQKPRVPWYASIWSQDRIQKSAKDKRKTILQNIINGMVTENAVPVTQEVEDESE